MIDPVIASETHIYRRDTEVLQERRVVRAGAKRSDGRWRRRLLISVVIV